MHVCVAHIVKVRRDATFNQRILHIWRGGPLGLTAAGVAGMAVGYGKVAFCMIYEPDDMDRKIIAALGENPRITNRELGLRTGLSERMAGARVAQLQASRVARVVVQRDIAALGHDLLAMLSIHAVGAQVSEVQEGVAAIEEVSAVVLYLGCPQIGAMIHARDREHLNELISGPVASVSGILRIEAEVMLDVVKYRSDITRFDV